MNRETGTAGTQWMTNSNRTAMRINPLRVEVETADAGQSLHREGLIQFDVVVVLFTRLFFQQSYRIHRTQTHGCRIATR